ncbi:MAG: hypothetical protein NTW50_00380 [Candidatus Berkelbacteria bacterium]|nr:hypothetical protein [Candidatus Berkelbacteria bacterium]
MVQKKSDEEVFNELNKIMTEVVADQEDLRRTQTKYFSEFQGKVDSKKISNIKQEIEGL